MIRFGSPLRRKQRDLGYIESDGGRGDLSPSGEPSGKLVEIEVGSLVRAANRALDEALGVLHQGQQLNH